MEFTVFLSYFILPLGSYIILTSMHFFLKDNSQGYYKISEPFSNPSFQYLRVKMLIIMATWLFIFVSTSSNIL